MIQYFAASQINLKLKCIYRGIYKVIINILILGYIDSTLAMKDFEEGNYSTTHQPSPTASNQKEVGLQSLSRAKTKQSKDKDFFPICGDKLLISREELSILENEEAGSSISNTGEKELSKNPQNHNQTIPLNVLSTPSSRANIYPTDSFEEEETISSLTFAKENGHLQYAGLSIDGGGVKTLVSAKVLVKLEEEIGSKSSPKIKLHEMFDYIGGTSTGGLLTLAITCPHFQTSSPRSLDEWIEELKYEKIIPKSFWNWLSQGIYSRYGKSIEKYESYLKESFGDLKLSDALTDIVITSTRLDSMKPFLFTKEHALADPNYDFLVRDVARATTAVVSQYPAATPKIGTETIYLIDGNICFCNSSQFVYNHIQRRSYEPGAKGSLFRRMRDKATHKNTYIFSIGGNTEIIDENNNAGKLTLAWGGTIVRHLMSGTNSGVSREMQGLLGNNYKRIKPTSNITNIAPDDTSAGTRETLKDAAKEIISSMSARDEFEGIATKLLEIKDLRDGKNLE